MRRTAILALTLAGCTLSGPATWAADPDSPGPPAVAPAPAPAPDLLALAGRWAGAFRRGYAAGGCPGGYCPVPAGAAPAYYAPPALTYVVPGRTPVLPASRPVVARPPALPDPAQATVPPPAEIVLPPPARMTYGVPEDAGRATESRETMLRTLNAGRVSVGLPPFVLDARLNEGAQVHSVAVASGRQPLGHAGFPGRYHAAGFPQQGTLSEGVFPEAQGVDLKYWCDWMLNPAQAREAHSLDYRNPNYRLIGIGYAAGNGGGYTGIWTIGYSDLDIEPVAPPPRPPTKPTPPTKPLPPVVVRPSPQGPGGGADTSSLADAAKYYYLSFPLELRGVAGDVASGKIADLDGLVAAIKAARARASKDMDRQLGEALAPLLNPDGTIADRAGVAKVIREIADAMTETQIHVSK